MIVLSEKHMAEIDFTAKKDLLPIREAACDWETPYYRAFAAISMQLHDIKILDCGTRNGQSAIALAHNPENRVVTYDTWNWGQEKHYQGKVKNIDFRIGDAIALRHDTYLSAALIFLDIDPHNGIQELAFYRRLTAIGYTGLLLCDDIRFPKAMEAIFWHKVRHSKAVFPEKYANPTGTGAIYFGEERISFE